MTDRDRAAQRGPGRIQREVGGQSLLLLRQGLLNITDPGAGTRFQRQFGRLVIDDAVVGGHIQAGLLGVIGQHESMAAGTMDAQGLLVGDRLFDLLQYLLLVVAGHDSA